MSYKAMQEAQEGSMAKRYELSHRQWACLKDFLPGKAGDRGRIIADSSMASCGSYGAGRGGVTSRRATATGRVSINALRAGRGPEYESKCLRI